MFCYAQIEHKELFWISYYLLRLDFCPKYISILKEITWTAEKNACSAVFRWNILEMSIVSI